MLRLPSTFSTLSCCNAQHSLLHICSSRGQLLQTVSSVPLTMAAWSHQCLMHGVMPVPGLTGCSMSVYSHSSCAHHAEQELRQDLGQHAIWHSV